jgi:hypothetical protein
MTNPDCSDSQGRRTLDLCLGKPWAETKRRGRVGEEHDPERTSETRLRTQSARPSHINVAIEDHVDQRSSRHLVLQAL